jgi:hypothetical protein
LCLRESILQGLILIIKSIENCKVKLRGIKMSLTVLKSLGIKNIIHGLANKELILPPEALYD